MPDDVNTIQEYDSPTPAPEVDIKSARGVFSRIGLAAFVLLAVVSGLQIGLAYLLLRGRESVPDWAMFAVTFLPLYLIGFPLGWRILRGVPEGKGERVSLNAGQLVPIVLIGFFFMLFASFGADDGNPIGAYALSDAAWAKVLFLMILAPLWEEFFFRRLIIDRIRPYGERLAVVTSAVMFGLFHGNLSQFFYALLLGLLFGYVYLRTGKLRYTAALHMLINFLGSVLAPALMGLSDAALAVYSLILTALAFAGLVCLLLRRRLIRFDPAEMELPKKGRFSVVWLNLGMLLFLAVCLGTIVYSLV